MTIGVKQSRVELIAGMNALRAASPSLTVLLTAPAKLPRRLASLVSSQQARTASTGAEGALEP